MTVSRTQLLLIAVIATVLAIFLASAGLYFRTAQLLAKLSTTEGQQELKKNEADKIVKSLAKVTYLPAEEPSIATILEPRSLATKSAFYKDVQKGDKLIVYQHAKKVFIFRPTQNLVVNVGPLITGDEK